MTESHSAGGRATEAGMAFQARVATWFAAQFLADVPIGTAFGLPTDSRLAQLQCETADPVDDVVAHLDNGAVIYVQCKTSAGITSGSESPLGGTLEQLVELYLQGKRPAPNNPASVVILAVPESAPRSLDNLEQACRMFDMGGNWRGVLAQLPEQRSDALKKFELHVRSFWPTVDAAPVSDSDLVSLARMFRIFRFADQSSDNDWRQTAHLLGRRLYGGDDAGEAPMEALLALQRKAIQTGAPANREGLLVALRNAGHEDVASPAFDADIKALVQYSKDERQRLFKHTVLPLEGAQPIQRDCLDPLAAATADGSLLVTGEPGAGKTGVLLRLAELLNSRGGPVIFLSVERFSGFTKRSDFRAEIGLEHDPIDVLAAWPGQAPGTLIIDALDASRGGASEPIVATFIADAVAKLGRRWSVVASIRSFDLRNGRRFREVMRGSPPDEQFAEPGLPEVRHFHVSRLSAGEVAKLSSDSPKLKDLEATAPLRVRELLRNIFNLSLAAELLTANVDAADIQRLATQSELIDKYEDIRLTSQGMRLAVKAAVTLMVHKRRLIVPAIAVNHDELDAVRASGVLVAAGRDTIAFAHHVLFDHIAGRFFLTADDPAELRKQLSGDPTIGLLLGPALRFSMERMWHDDAQDRANTWGFLVDLAGETEPDPVILSTALRTAAEQVVEPNDVAGLLAVLKLPARSEVRGKLLGQLARFVGLVVGREPKSRMSVSQSQAWALVAQFAAEQDNLRSVDAARILLMIFVDQAALGDPQVDAAFGTSARAMLAFAWSKGPEFAQFAAAAIRFVTRSFGSDPAKSRVLLERILDDRFDEFAPVEAPWLASGVESILPHDPEFVVRIFSTLFERDVTDEAKTYFGGSPSRIMPLMSTRTQDYQHGRWQLGSALKNLLKTNPDAAARAVIAAVRGIDTEGQRERGRKPSAATEVVADGRSVRVVGDYLSLQDWRESRTHDAEVLTALVNFLKACPADAFQAIVKAAISEVTNSAVWARILGIAADRPGVADDLLWPLVANPRFTWVRGLTRDAIIFVGAAYPARTQEEREAFETALLGARSLSDDGEAGWRYLMGRLLSTLPEALLATQGMRELREELNSKQQLTGNRPYMSMSMGWGEGGDAVDGMLRSVGADLEKSPDREIRAASRVVERALKATEANPDETALAGLWRHALELVQTLDEAAGQEAHPQLIRSSWGAVSNGVERVASSPNYEPGTAGLPSLDEMVMVVDRLSASQYPAPKDQSSDSMSWGNWDVRVYAAESLMALAPRFGASRPDLIDRLLPLMEDPVPTVRHQITQALNVLWDAANGRMWDMTARVAENERHHGVLSFFVAGTLWRMAHAEPERVAGLLSKVLEREQAATEARDEDERDRLAESAANLMAFLFVASNRPEAWGWIERWVSNVRYGDVYLGPMLHSLREAFFLCYRDGAGSVDVERAQRALQVIGRVTEAAAAAEAEARSHLTGSPTEDEIATWRPQFIAADRLIDQVCNQLYFGSGAFRPQNDPEPVGLPTTAAKSRFLLDYGPILTFLDRHAKSRTVYNLVSLYGFLMDGNPEAVFDRVAAMLLGAGAEDGYQNESLGSDGLVELVRRYLADHRGIFADAGRRSRLIEVLELFSEAGWPEALKLMFELPDLLR